MANDRPKMRIQNRAVSFQAALPVRRPMPFSTTISSANPIVNCGKM